MKENWNYKNISEIDAAKIAQKYRVKHTAAKILLARGYSEGKDLFEFLYPSPSRFHSPFLLKDIDRAVNLLKEAFDQKFKIGIYTDSDIDGLSSLAVVKYIFDKFGADYMYLYPQNEDGYGLNISAVDNFYNKGVKIILTLDCGIRDLEEINYAKKFGMRIIVCDHHEADEKTPDCICVNPKQSLCEYPFQNLAGVGVAFKLMQAFLFSYLPVYDKSLYVLYQNDSEFKCIECLNGSILKMSNESDLNILFEELPEDAFLISIGVDKNKYSEKLSKFSKHKYIDEMFYSFEVEVLFKNLLTEFKNFSHDEKDYANYLVNLIYWSFSEKIFKLLLEIIPFAAIGTIADVMPLENENRILVKSGLEQLKFSSIPSLKKITHECYNDFTSRNIAWSIAPVLNAPGRFGKPEMTADFLSSSDEKGNEIYSEIKVINNERKKMVNDQLEKIENDISQYDEDEFIFINEDYIFSGICGLIAGRLSDKYNKPVVIISRDNDSEYSKGSGRAPDFLDFINCVENDSEIFEKFGGHSSAFGFSIYNDKIEAMKSMLKKNIKSLEISKPYFDIDAKVNAEEITFSLLDEISELRPFGNKNPDPVFYCQAINFDNGTVFGKKNEHLKLFMNDIEFIFWKHGDKYDKLLEKSTLSIIFNINRSNFGRKNTLRAEVLDFC